MAFSQPFFDLIWPRYANAAEVACDQINKVMLVLVPIYIHPITSIPRAQTG
jgi:hypothetical protein